jgi:hypothetical protein
MQPQQATQAGPITLQGLKELAAAGGPCITVHIPLRREDNRLIPAIIKDALHEVQKRLQERNFEPKQIKALLEPLRGLEDSIDSDPQQKGAVILRSPEIFSHYYVAEQIDESVTVAGHFHLLPLIPTLREKRPFYILALSQKHIRLLRCTNSTSEEVDLPATIPRSLDDFLQIDQPDHMQDNGSASGPSTGSMGRVMFGTGTDKEHKDEYLLHFYKEIDRGISNLLKDDPAALVIAGVEYELTLYQSESKFPRLVDTGVRGAPDGLKGGELHKRALEVIQPYWDKDIAEALAMFDQLGTERISLSLKEIVKGAFDGRVLHLFVARDAREMGNFDEATHRVRKHSDEQPGDEDLINAAAVQTVNHAGNVFVLPRNKIPHGSQIAALMRY